MRLYSSSLLLFGATVLQHAELVVANTVKFDAAGMIPKPQNGTSAFLFTMSELQTQGLQFPFFTNANISLSEVSLCQFVPVERQHGSPNVLAWFPSLTNGEPPKVPNFYSPMNPSPVALNMTMSANTTVNIGLNAAAAEEMLRMSKGRHDYMRMPEGKRLMVLYFKLKYSLASGLRRRQSQTDTLPSPSLLEEMTRYFALTDVERDTEDFKKMAEEVNIPNDDGTSTPGEPSGGSQPTASPGNPISSPTVGPESANPGPASSSSSSDGKLSTGAIAGIAVGAGVGFLLIAGGLAFCLLRRRRRNAEATHVRGYNGGGRSGDIIAEKEAANAAVSESGAHSPYSDDGRPHFQRDVALAGAGAGASAATGTAGLMAAHHQDEQSAGADYTPYSDRPSNVSMADTAVGSASAIGTASSTPMAQPASAAAGPAGAVPMEGERVPVMARSDTAMSGTYAHLVEDGMTAAEIARLEDEERQLDQAIERARGVTTK
ncbi:hypothetical protein PspLS_07335 [Pyricularia sp. CBS 133598]|nr:hypothetical protein PspLS_07335 [Pyricularia sp. CBS 133598]